LMLFITPPILALMSLPFPYTTLFRSSRALLDRSAAHHAAASERTAAAAEPNQRSESDDRGSEGRREGRHRLHRRRRAQRHGSRRSEEHTSELESHLNIVCSLLLEKKK